MCVDVCVCTCVRANLCAHKHVGSCGAEVSILSPGLGATDKTVESRHAGAGN